MLPDLFNQAVDGKVNSVEIEDNLLLIFEGETQARGRVETMREAMFDNQDIIFPVAPTSKRKAKKAVDVRSKRVLDTNNSSRLTIVHIHGSHSQANRPSTDISDEQKTRICTPWCQKNKHSTYGNGMK